jgi:hypothetical protein
VFNTLQYIVQWTQQGDIDLVRSILARANRQSHAECVCNSWSGSSEPFWPPILGRIENYNILEHVSVGGWTTIRLCRITHSSTCVCRRLGKCFLLGFFNTRCAPHIFIALSQWVCVLCLYWTLHYVFPKHSLKASSDWLICLWICIISRWIELDRIRDIARSLLKCIIKEWQFKI